MRDNERPRPGPAGWICILALPVLLATGGTASAAVATGGAATPGSAPTPKGSPSGTPDPAPSSGAVSLVSATAAPRKSFFFGFRYPRFSFTIAGSQSQNDLQVNVVNSAGEVVRSFYRSDVAPNVATAVRWDGTTAEGRPARNGRYTFQVVPQGSTVAARRASASTTVGRGLRPLRLRLPGARRP